MSTVGALPRTVPLKCRSGAVDERFKSPEDGGLVVESSGPISVASSPSTTHLLEELAIALTSGLGPTPGAETGRLRNILARVSLHDALLSKIVMCVCPWQCDKQEFLGPNTLIKQGAERGDVEARVRGISLRQYDLCWSGLPAMNPAGRLRHL
jgi:hypothetical protein